MLHEGMPVVVDSIAAFEHDKPHDECGVFGIYAPGMPVGQMAFFGTIAQEHRGASGSGISYYNPADGKMVLYKGLGKVREAVPEMLPVDGVTLAEKAGSHLALGQNRYSTDPSNDVAATQPFPLLRTGGMVVNNGNVESLASLAAEYGISPNTAPSDSGLVADIFDKRLFELGDMKAALSEVLPKVRGAYCLVIAYKGSLIGVRDPQGVHPLSLGTFRDGKGGVIASETTAFAGFGLAENDIRDIQPGEAVIIGEHGIESFQFADPVPAAHCLFEHIYFGDEGSVLNGSHNRGARYIMGRLLAGVVPVEADMVVGVPNSGLPFAEGYADASGIPLVAAIRKNPRVSRTFILRGEERDAALARKFDIDEGAVAGQRLVVVDDSTIKGNTPRSFAGRLWDAGAVELHFRFGAPPYVSPCNLGMDTCDPSELVAMDRSNDEIAAALNATSVAFNSFAAVEGAINSARTSPTTPSLLGKFCRGCTMGEYPITVPESLQIDQRRQLGVHVLAHS